MISKEFHIVSTASQNSSNSENDLKAREQILNIINTAFQQGAIVELKVLEGVDLIGDGKRFSKIRVDIISNTDFDKFEI